MPIDFNERFTNIDEIKRVMASAVTTVAEAVENITKTDRIPVFETNLGPFVL